MEKRGAQQRWRRPSSAIWKRRRERGDAGAPQPVARTTPSPRAGRARRRLPRRAAVGCFNLRRLFSYTRREALELRRDPIRLTLAVLGSVILMFVMGYGISMDVEDLTFAVLDRDQTTISRDYVLNLAGSRYFIEHPPIRDYDELDRRMRSGEISLAIEIPPGFARDVARGTPVQIGAWIDGAMPHARRDGARLCAGHARALARRPRRARPTAPRQPPGLATIETRFRYNPDVKSLLAMVPAVIPLLLMLIPAMLTRAVGGAGEGAGLHRQSLRHAGHPAGVPARQADPLRRAGDAQLPAADRAGGVPVSACR